VPKAKATFSRRHPVRSLARLILKEHPLVLLGAGISKLSGLPLAGELRGSVLRCLGIGRKERSIIATSGLPFEAFMECVADVTDISEILAIFDEGDPNSNHIFLARLAGRGLITRFVTTNFDDLLERAFISVGHARLQRVRVRYTQTDLAEWTGAEPISIVKLHGSVTRKASIRTTLHAVANRAAGRGRGAAVQQLLLLARLRPLLILGYSASDAFDINPVIRADKQPKRYIVYIEHRIGRAVRTLPLSSFSSTNPFQSLRGVRLQCDTTKVIRALWRSLHAGDYVAVSGQVHWEDKVRTWSMGLLPGINCLVTAKLFFQVSRPRPALRYCTEALRRLPRGNIRARASTWILKGQAHHTLGDYRRSIACWRRASELVTRTHVGLYASAQEKIGGAFVNLGDYVSARTQYARALRFARKARQPRLVSLCHAGLGTVAHGRKRFREAIAHEKNALRLARRIGFATGEAAYRIMLASAQTALGFDAVAEEGYTAAATLASLVGYPVGQISAEMGLAELSLSRREYTVAEEYYRTALDRSRDARFRTGMRDCYLGLGQISIARAEFRPAFAYLRRARKLARKSSAAREVDICAAIADAYDHLGRTKLANRYRATARRLAAM